MSVFLRHGSGVRIGSAKEQVDAVGNEDKAEDFETNMVLRHGQTF